jgi:hypothetical protein
MAEAPRGWMTWRPSFVERGQRTLFAIPTRHNIPSGSKDLPKADDARESAPHSLADLTKRFEDMKFKAPDPSYDRDSEDEIERKWTGYDSDRGDSDRDEAKDFAACDIECDYCGRCPY